ncbi:MAG TPA: hypothetical protein VIG77_00210 [Ktedonobacterales bacterium]|jgi:hypothetical protein
MWQSATASAVLLVSQQHLFFGGLGEAIAVIVGGVVSVITMRKIARGAAHPVPTPAPVSRRPAAPPAYGAPAPPTTPARRLHPGPVSLSAPTPPSSTPASTPTRHAEGEDDAPLSSLFNPDIFERPQPAPPMLRPISAITAEWRAQAAASSALAPTPNLTTPAPIWNHAPFARPAAPAAATPVVLGLAPEAALVIAPPIWRRPAASAPDVAPMEAERPASAEAAPIWGSWLSAASDTADDASDVRPVERLQAPGETANDEPNPPIWSSFLRRE